MLFIFNLDSYFVLSFSLSALLRSVAVAAGAQPRPAPPSARPNALAASATLVSIRVLRCLWPCLIMMLPGLILLAAPLQLPRPPHHPLICLIVGFVGLIKLWLPLANEARTQNHTHSNTHCNNATDTVAHSVSLLFVVLVVVGLLLSGGGVESGMWKVVKKCVANNNIKIITAI